MENARNTYLIPTINNCPRQVRSGLGREVAFTGEDVCVEGEEGEVDCEVGNGGIGFEY
jgi:hypothetical protein